MIGLKCGQLYGGIAPRKAILYTALSHVVIAVIYFTVIGSPRLAARCRRAVLTGILAFVGMPFAAAAAALSFIAPQARRARSPRAAPASPRSFWKLIAVTFVFSFVVVALRSMLVEVSPIDVIAGQHAPRHAAAAWSWRSCSRRRPSASRGSGLISARSTPVIMAAVVALIAFCPIVGVTHLGWSALVTFLSAIFEFVLWCILAFVVYQRHISSVLVFGFGYGMFMVGSGAGWLAGVHLFPQIAVTSNSIVLYLVLAFAVLACAFVLFSEKEFDRLFKPEGEASLDDLLGDELPDPHADDEAPAGKKGRFGLAIDALAEQAGLSRREKDVLRCLAMGYDTGATAKRLQVSWNTVRTHTRNVYAKLDIHSPRS